jgi:hypothetical protein
VLYGSGEHKAGHIGCKVGSCCLKVPLILLNFDRKVGDVIIDLPVSRNLSRQAPVIGVGYGGLEDVKVTARTGEHVSKPCG